MPILSNYKVYRLFTIQIKKIFFFTYSKFLFNYKNKINTSKKRALGTKALRPNIPIFILL